MSATPSDLVLAIFDSPAGRRLDDVRNILTFVVARHQPHDRAKIQQVAEGVFELAMRFLLPDDAGKT
jgi:hypothetical protein